MIIKSQAPKHRARRSDFKGVKKVLRVMSRNGGPKGHFSGAKSGSEGILAVLLVLILVDIIGHSLVLHSATRAS